jgi:hypothetical protein
MSLPKTFHQKTNLPNLYKSLNNLKFYRFTFSITTTTLYNEFIVSGEDFGTGLNISDELGVILSGDRDNVKICEKTISSMTEEISDKKITEWLEKFLDNGVISDYVILNKKELSFRDILEDKHLLNLFHNEI